MKPTEFNLMRRGGYSTSQVDLYIQGLETEMNRVRQELRVVLAQSQKHSGVPQLYDPEGAVVKVLAAAQTAADKMISEAEITAKEKVATYHRQNKEEIEAQARIYANEKSQLASKLSEVRAMQGELKREVKELVEQSNFKMTVIAQVARELEGLTVSTEILGSAETQKARQNTERMSGRNEFSVASEISQPRSSSATRASSAPRPTPIQRTIEQDSQRDAWPSEKMASEEQPSQEPSNEERTREESPANAGFVEEHIEDIPVEDFATGEMQIPRLMEPEAQPTEFFDPLLTADNHG